jgi:hypothetical protein
MPAFRITINGRKYCESDDITTLTMVVEELSRSPHPRISLHAGASQGPLQWLTANLGVGDEIRIEIVDEVDGAAIEVACSFCGEAPVIEGMLVHGPSAAICDRCLDDFGAAVGLGMPLPPGAGIRSEPEWTCAFCAKSPGDVPGVVVRNGAAVCPTCLRACADIVTDRRNRS